MPTPMEILLDPITLTLLALYLGLFALENLFPARKQPRVKGWHTKTLVAFVGYFALATYLPFLWDQYLAPYQLFNLEALHPAISTSIALVVFQLLLYAWHRSMHQSDWLWRIFHQMHHSAERVDIPGAFYFSPLDMIGFTLLGSLSLVLVVGISPQAATYFLLITQFLVVFQHCNVCTPHWLGYIIQRPESHAVHHGKGIHAYNYCDLPVIDMVFGTFRNPKYYDVDAGFYHGASGRVWDMLRWKDVSKETEQKQCSSI